MYKRQVIGRKRRLKERRKIYEEQYEKNPTYIAEDFITGEREVFNSKERALDSFKREKGMRTPDMPYKKTDQWIGLAIRRVMKMAADKGLDRIAWVTGEQSAERYDLSKQIDEIKYFKYADGTYSIEAKKDGDYVFSKSPVKESELENIVGKELALKMINNEGTEKAGEVDKFLEGEGLEVGGEGMKTFYNSIVPKVSKAEAQRFDKNADIEVIEISQGNAENSKQLSIPITPEMKEELEGGIGVMREQRMAPNGKPSKLTPKQYDIVRTPAFKRWFGDWQNDPENASKVVDENGEPQVVWRGRDKTKGDVGDIIDIGKTEEGAFFADNKEAANLFMSEFIELKKGEYEVIESFLNIRNPEVFEDFWNDFLSSRYSSGNGRYTPNKNVDGAIIKDDVWLQESEIDFKEGQFDEFGNELDEEIIKEIALEGKQFIALDSKQIKSADGSNTTFDPSKPSIRQPVSYTHLTLPTTPYV